MLDFLIRNSLVYTGRLEAPQRLQVGIQGEKIALIAPEEEQVEARQVIDAEGLILCPGFIDPHASTGFGYFFPEAANHKLYQGITTEIFGNCGTSPAPIGEQLVPTLNRLAEQIGFPFDWRSLEEYFVRIKDHLQFNIATLVGHSTLRGGYLDNWNEVTDQDMQHMSEALRQAMRDGALGLSTGLIYAPGCFAETEEIVELAKVVAEQGGVYASHIRSERDEIEAAVTEALHVGKEAKIKVLISHLKAAERPNWGKIPKVLAQIEAYNRSSEVEATVDVYPYTAVSTKLRAFIPKYILQDGIAAVSEKMSSPKVRQDIAEWIEQKGYDLSKMLIISDDLTDFYGKNVADIAIERNESEAESIAAILAASTEAWVVYHCISEEDMDRAVTWPKAMICTDSWSYPVNAPKSIGQPHPRSYGAFTTFLERYVLQKKSLSWQEAIHKITYLPARFFQLGQRGEIKEGYFADLVLLRPEAVKANATYLQPRRLSSGVEHLWVNGQLTIFEKNVLPAKAGQILKPSHEFTYSHS